MSSPTPASHIETMRASLQMLDLQLDRAGLSPQGIADLKSEIDSMRLRLWGIMSADRGKAVPHALERFRLRRGTEIISQIADELEKGGSPADVPEALTLGEAAERLLRALGRTGTPEGRRTD